MSQSAHLEIVVTSGGIQGAGKDLKDLTAYSKETEAQQKQLAGVFAEMAAAEEKAAAKAAAAAAKQAEAQEKAAQKAIAAAEQQAAKAVAAADRESARQAKQLARENEQWNDALQRAIARNEKRAASAEKAAQREEEAWNRAIQRAKAGLDGVLPIRPSLQRIEARVNETSQGGSLAGLGLGLKEGAISALGLGALAGGGAAIGSTIADGIHKGIDSVIALSAELGNLQGRITGVTGDAGSAREKFEELESMTLGKLPSTVREVSESFIFLGNTGLNNSREALKSYSNIAAQTGHSLGDVTRSVELASQGNYRSLREYGIKVKEEGDNLQVTFRGQTETIGKSAEAMEAYMQHLGSVEFAGAVDRQMDTIGGAVKRTSDAWEKLITTVADSSLGSLIQSTVGASTSVIDAMTASVDALFDKVHKGMREIEADKARIAEQDKLDKTMVSWADPSASRSEIAQLQARLEAHAQSSADKALEQYSKNAALIEKLRVLGEERVGDMTLDEASAENERQYRRDNGADKPKQAGYAPTITVGQQTNYAAYMQMAQKQEYEQYLAVRDSLSKQEDAERASYEKRLAFLADYTGPDSEELWDKNSKLWSAHLDDIAAKSAKAQLELQKHLQNIGIGPQSQTQVIQRKYAGQQTELESALSDNLSGKNGDVLRLQAEQTYAQKSVEIEKARAREIEQINRDLAQQSMQNAGMIFGGLATAMKNAHGEQSKEYRAMFAAQKAFAIATAEVAMYTDMAKANEAGFPANIPLYIKAAADGAQIIAQLASLSYSGAYDSGGTIPAGSFGLVGERRPELLTSPTLVRGPATVVGGQATADMFGRQTQPQSLRIVNAYDGGEAVKGYLGSTEGEQVLVNFVKRNGPLIRSVTR